MRPGGGNLFWVLCNVVVTGPLHARRDAWETGQRERVLWTVTQDTWHDLVADNLVEKIDRYTHEAMKQHDR